jgi:hypothetical protein
MTDGEFSQTADGISLRRVMHSASSEQIGLFVGHRMVLPFLFKRKGWL